MDSCFNVVFKHVHYICMHFQIKSFYFIYLQLLCSTCYLLQYIKYFTHREKFNVTEKNEVIYVISNHKKSMESKRIIKIVFRTLNY